MRIAIIAVCNRLPDWARQLCTDYGKRLPAQVQLQHYQVKPATPAIETQRLLLATPKIFAKAQRVAMCVQGKSYCSESFAQTLGTLWQEGQNLVIYIGGASGLSEELKQNCPQRWSLSSLTLAHVLAQVVLVEQIYRGFTILQKQPYHLAH